MNIFLLTVGSQGDVQPFVALGQGLQNAGHTVTIATGQGFGPLIEPRGLRYAPLNADYLQMIQSPEGKAALAGKNLLSMIRQVMPVLRQVMEDAWQAAQDADLIIYHPKALAGYHIADKLGIPAILSLPVPMYSPTRAFAAPGLPFTNLGGLLNRLSYSLIIQGATASFRGMINAWRKETLGLPPARGENNTLRGRPISRIYPISPHVLPPPADWDANTYLTGYWFLRPLADWQPPEGLVNFIEAGPAPIYVGFGSMATEDAARVTRTVVDAVQQAGVRAVLASGWGGIAETALPENVCIIQSAPHDWLFPRMAAVVHHGGAGTTAAGLRAGKPTVICPLFGDQPFWGKRVEALGVGPAPLPLKKLNAADLAAAIRQSVNQMEMRERAKGLGEKIRAEDGVAQAVSLINRLAVIP